MIEIFDHISVACEDPKALAEWYRDVLGLEIVMEMKPSKRRKLPLYYLKTKRSRTLIEIIPPDIVEAKRGGHLAFEVDDLDKAVEELASKGVKVRDIRTSSLGWKVGFFDDPRGREIEILCRPKGTPRFVEAFVTETTMFW